MVSTIESGSELLKSLRIEAFSTIYKISVLVLIVIFIWSYRKYRVSEEIETHFSAFHLTWLSLGMCIACIFCFIGDNTDFFVFFSGASSFLQPTLKWLSGDCLCGSGLLAWAAIFYLSLLFGC